MSFDDGVVETRGFDAGLQERGTQQAPRRVDEKGVEVVGRDLGFAVGHLDERGGDGERIGIRRRAQRDARRVDAADREQGEHGRAPKHVVDRAAGRVRTLLAQAEQHFERTGHVALGPEDVGELDLRGEPEHVGAGAVGRSGQLPKQALGAGEVVPLVQ